MGAFLGTLFGSSMGGILGTLPGVSSFFTFLQQTNNSLFPVSLFSASDYYQMLRMDYLSLDDYYNYMARLGYGHEMAKRYALSQQTPIDLQTYLSLDITQRLGAPDIPGGLSDQSITKQVFDWLDINPDVYKLYKQSRMYIPSVTELNQMYITNAFNDTIATNYKLDEDLDQSVYDNYAKLGINAYWTKTLWRSTWNYPSFYEAKYMYDYTRAHPDPNGFNDEDFYNLMKAKNYSSYFANLYKQILNTPLTISEISRMYEAGTVNEADVIKLLKWEGRSDEQIGYLLPWIKVTYAPESARGMKHYTESMIVELYTNGIIDKQQFEDYLGGIKYDKDSITVIEEYIALKEILQDRAALKADVLEKYKAGQIDEADGITVLVKGGYSQQQAQYIMDKAMLTKTIPHRKLSLSDLTKLAGAKLISMDEYTSYLSAIGYSDSDIDLLKKLYGFSG